MFSKKILFFILFLNGIKVNSQVILQSGAAQFNLPLFSYNDQNGLSTSISLKYIDGNGLKVAEVASSVGTGWNLDYGGAITREQRGLPDDQKRSLTIPNPLPKYVWNLYVDDKYYKQYFPNGYLNSYYSPSDPITNEGGLIKMYSPSYPLAAGLERYRVSNADFLFKGWDASLGDLIPENEFIIADREQDIFHIKAGNIIADFVIGKNGQIKVLNDSRIKVEMVIEDMLSQNITTCIGQFIITDEAGEKYIFSQKELSQTLTYTNTRNPNNGITDLNDVNVGGNYSVDATVINFAQRRPTFIVTQWYLTKITNPLLSSQINNSISFLYEQFDIDLTTQRNVNYVISGTKSSNSVSINREVVKTYRIKSITCPQNTIVYFTYATVPRVDLPNASPLTNISISENGTVYKQFLLDFAYFFTSVIKPYDYQFLTNEKFATRLCLKSIQNIGDGYVKAEPPYIFDYYTGNPLTPGLDIEDIVPSMNTYWTDHWGYFNSKYPYSFEFRPDQIPYAGLLTDMCINYAVSKSPVSGRAKNGILKQITYPLGSTLNYEYEQNDVLYAGQNISYGGVRVKKTIVYDGISHLNDLIREYNYKKPDGLLSSGWGYEVPIYSMNSSRRIYSTSAGKSGASYRQFANSFITDFIKSYASKIGVNASFSASLRSASVFAAIAIVVKILVDFFGPTPPEYIDDTQTEYSYVAYQFYSPLPFQYSRVEVFDKNSTGNINGKVVYEFRSEIESPITVPLLTFPYSKKDRFIKWAYGMPTKIGVYDKTGKQIQETVNEYDVISSYIIDPNFLSKTWLPNIITVDAWPFHSYYLNQFGIVTEALYYPLKGHSELKKSTENLFGKTGELVSQKITTYTYNPLNFQPATLITKNSKNNEIKQNFYYPEDFTFGSFCTTLINANKVTTPVLTETWQTKPGGLPEIIGSNVTEFGSISSGDIKPIKFYALQTATPQPQSSFGVFNPAVLIRNTGLIKLQKQIDYNASGNMVQLNDVVGSKSNAIIYDYKDQNKISTVNNANISDIAYSSFEGDIQEGGWSYIPSNILSNIIDAPTGKRVFALRPGNTIVKTGLNPTKTYILSYFMNSNDNCIGCSNLFAAINGQSYTSLISTTVVNKWTLVFNKVVNPPNGTITISGNMNIDELRLYPSNSTMATATYNNGFGKSSECDINNRIKYYEYDGLGRIMYIKDENRNLLKAFEYQYQQSPSNSLFYNIARTGIFSKKCAQGLFGGIYTTTIPANTYTSTLNQEDADNQAYNALIVTGQSNADLYASVCVPYTAGSAGISCYISSVNMPDYTFCNTANITVYTTNSPIQPGVQLYADILRSQKITNRKWVRSLETNVNTIWALSITGVVLTTEYIACSSLPVPIYKTEPCSVTSDLNPVSAFCFTGNQYSSVVYTAFGASIGIGTQLYTDIALTQKLINKTWIRFYSGNSVTVWPLTSDGKISGNPTKTCPL